MLIKQIFSSWRLEFSYIILKVRIQLAYLQFSNLQYSIQTTCMSANPYLVILASPILLIDLSSAFSFRRHWLYLKCKQCQYISIRTQPRDLGFIPTTAIFVSTLNSVGDISYLISHLNNTCQTFSECFTLQNLQHGVGSKLTPTVVHPAYL